ncbi:AAA family ATPase [Salimicrobium halophilum]|uniref:AAA+-type ATPase, SpoVK/Ycf46/Vps4 family n=1 Tax=Salimicrobium halophilum TaxID=86666 RepID=A0A1G8Q591_9BACI|nr:AAA family ATPase [Salimicrobium halophilum]SDI99883.1 AAA+-type ATPase, SpoVK/Ycf46/Vps4 family [Salimicrobium halophilum]
MALDHQWTSLETAPPWSETEILRMLDEHSLEPAEEALLYVAYAYYRLQRYPEGDALSPYILKRAKEKKQTLKLARDMEVVQHLLSVVHHTRTAVQEAPMIHETDHISQKMKKTADLHDSLHLLLKYFDEGYLNHTVVDAASKWKTYQELYEIIRQLESIVREALETREGKRMKLSVTDVTLLLRQVKEKTNELKLHIPQSFLQEEKRFALDALEDMIGLEEVKTYIHQYYHFLKYQQDRKTYGFSMVDAPSLHMIMTGNPGTGKTTLARLLAEIYYELGLLQSTEVVEVNRSHLVGSYMGQSEENTMNYIKEAAGGILFIDEAYSLKREGQSGNDYGQAVIDTLVSAMTSKEYGGTFAVILAGYPEEMRQFLWANPGLRSRIPDQNRVDLPDYSLDELLEIGEKAALENDFFFTRAALRRLEALIEKEQVDESFGNARSVRNLVTKTIFYKGSREVIRTSDDWLSHMRITESDMRWEEEESKDTGSGMERLQNLIGLYAVKEEVEKLSSFVQMQQKRKQEGYPTVPIQLHSVFSGNPGTGKTTVAEIYASVLKECGLLKRGHVVVASRSDLVAGFVGQTAMKTKKKIREALGGVLFIDEAYSLHSGNRDDFGREAIETLVDEMTKHNENLVVILAGYEKEMKRLIESNPGLSSRFKKFFHFPDYSPQEMLEMMEKLAGAYQYELSGEARNYLERQLEANEVEGNGRFIGNLMDEAVQYHAWLQMEEKPEHVFSKEDIEEAWKAVRRESKA